MNRRTAWIGCVIALLMTSGCALRSQHSGTLYQVSTLQGLMAGAFDGVVTFGELRRHGDLGIGTLQGLDGEMVLVDGRAWQARADGKVVPVADWQTTPFAATTWFRPDRQVEVKGPVDAAGLGAALDEQLGTKNVFYVVRIDGRFRYVKTRSVPKQTPPYPLLLEASKQQSVFERHDVEGTLVALRCPAYAKDINMAGWHMHFLAGDRHFGGHVLDLRLDQATARVAALHQIDMVLPNRGRFVEVDLTQVTEQDVHKVEK